MSRAREARDVRGMKWFFRAWAAEMRRSHSRAMAVARAGLLAGMVMWDFVLGARTGRESSITVWWPAGSDFSFVFCDGMEQ